MKAGFRSLPWAFTLLVGSVQASCGTPRFIVVDGGSADGSPIDAALDAPLDSEGTSDSGGHPSDGGAGGYDASTRFKTPTTLVTGEVQPKGITVDAARLFWVNLATTNGPGAVRTLAKGGSSATTVVADQTEPIDIAVDDANIYWSVNTATPSKAPQCMAMKMARPSGVAECMTSAALMTGRMAISTKDVFLSGSTGTLTYVGFVPTTVVNATLAQILAPMTEAVAGDGSDLFLGDGSHIDTDAINAGGTGLTIETALCNANCGSGTTVDIVVGASGAVFWATDQGQVVTATPGPNPTPAILATVAGMPKRIAADGSYVYVTSAGAASDDGTVLAVPIEGGTPKILASGEVSPFGITVDENNVYWTCDNGTIRATGLPE